MEKFVVDYTHQSKQHNVVRDFFIIKNALFLQDTSTHQFDAITDF